MNQFDELLTSKAFEDQLLRKVGGDEGRARELLSDLYFALILQTRVFAEADKAPYAWATLRNLMHRPKKPSTTVTREDLSNPDTTGNEKYREKIYATPLIEEFIYDTPEPWDEAVLEYTYTEPRIVEGWRKRYGYYHTHVRYQIRWLMFNIRRNIEPDIVFDPDAVAVPVTVAFNRADVRRVCMDHRLGENHKEHIFWNSPHENVSQLWEYMKAAVSVSESTFKRRIKDLEQSEYAAVQKMLERFAPADDEITRCGKGDPYGEYDDKDEFLDD
jgi:hypothetical protein